MDAPADLAQKSKLSKLSQSDVSATKLAGDQITAIETHAPTGGALGGLKVSTSDAWFAARPSGTEDVYKIYGESFKSEAHLAEVLSEAQLLVDSAISGR